MGRRDSDVYSLKQSDALLRLGPAAYLKRPRIDAKCGDHFLQADSQGTSSVLCGYELKPELCGLFPESVLSPLYGFFVVTGPSFCTKRCESLHHSFGL
jgi:hypothetical protein